MLAAVILAAGSSSRMGSPKALLRGQEGWTFVSGLARTLASADVSELVVVAGDAHDAIAKALRTECGDLAVRLVRNTRPERGQLSSLWVGLDSLDRASVTGVLVNPVDVPLVSEATVRAVVGAWRETRAPVVRPAIAGRHGHPVLFDRAVFDELSRAPLDVGAKAVIRARAGQVVDVAVLDGGCLLDIDTPEDYRRHIHRKS